jgi:hypothetical protein
MKANIFRNANQTPRFLPLGLLCILSGILGYIIFFWGSPTTAESRQLILTPEFLTWFFFNEMLFASYPILIMVLLKPILKLKNQLAKYKFEIVGSVVILLVLYLIPQVFGNLYIRLTNIPLEYVGEKLMILMVVGFFVSTLPTLIGIFLTQAAISDTFVNTPVENEVEKYIEYRDQLNQFLMILGAMLSILIIIGAALRKVAIIAGAVTEVTYPIIYLVNMGTYYTLLIALIYFPAYQTLVSAGRRLLDACFPLLAANTQSWLKQYTDRKALEELLEIKISVQDRLITSITVLAPFLSSILSLLMDK